MKTICCEKCGKELGFFDRRQSLNNDRLGIHYDTLCKKCASTVNGALVLMDQMYNHMIGALKERYALKNMAAADLDLLIFLSVEAIYTYVPNFNSPASDINGALICRGEYNEAPEEDLCLLVDKLIDYGFSLNKKNAQIMDLKNYFKRHTLYVAQVGFNSKEAIPKTYYNMVVTSRGIVASHMENSECFSLPLEENQEIPYTILNDRDIVLENMTYPDIPERQPILFTVNEQQSASITVMLDQMNDLARLKKENRRRNLITMVTRGTLRDLNQIRPDGDFSLIPLDCLLIFITKNMMSDAQGREAPLYGEDSPVLDILYESFYENLLMFGRTERSELADYMLKNTLLSEGFYIQYEGGKREKAWAFFTTRGYIIGFMRSRKFVYVFEDTFPNDIYYPCNDCIYQGCRFLQLAENRRGKEASGNYKDFDGLIFFSEDIDLIGKMNRFFNLNNIFYVMDRYVEAEEKIYGDRASVLEVKRISDKLFGEFSFLPFCQYDEWAAICEKMKEDDFLMCQLIDRKESRKKRHPAAPTSYTVRIMRSFGSCAKELNSTLRLGDVSIAKAILWGYFNESLVDTLSKEWIRVAGDMVDPDVSLEEAFARYFALKDIQSDKSYYMGLFIYYLMSKGILPADDFLENYERGITLYRSWHKGVADESPAAAASPVSTKMDNGEMAASDAAAKSEDENTESVVKEPEKDAETKDISAEVTETDEGSKVLTEPEKAEESQLAEEVALSEEPETADAAETADKSEAVVEPETGSDTAHTVTETEEKADDAEDSNDASVTDGGDYTQISIQQLEEEAANRTMEKESEEE